MITTTFASIAKLREAMERKLKDSGLDAKDAKVLRLEPVMAPDVPDGLPAQRSGFRIPYFDLNGKPTQFYRFRYLEYGQNGFERLVKAKLLRYGQLANTTNELYLPPLGVDWKVYANLNKPIIITEGELKAAAATRLGMPTIGLGGVWCWKSKKHGVHLLDAFLQFEWKERPAYICFDSDAATNPNVVMAENSLARELTHLGARTYIVRLPALSPEAKTGLDDYLVAKGDDALMKLLKRSAEWATSKELFQLNEEVLYVTDPGLIIKVNDFQVLTPRAFQDHAYSTRRYHELQTNTKGETKLVEKSAPKEWINWPLRATVNKITYAPGKGLITEEGALNCWRGFRVEPRRGSVTPWIDLLKYLFDGTREAMAWFEQWLAYPLQNPGAKLYSAAVIWGGIQGTGKSLVGYTMQQIYGDNFTEIKDCDLYASHNEWAQNKQFVMGDEITGGDKRSSADRMKSMITQQLLRINPKFITAYTVPDCINYYFTSNHPDAFFLEDRDRRFFIWEVKAEPRQKEFYLAYVKWLREEGGAAALFDRFLSLDLGGFSPGGHALQTAAKAEMIELGRSDLGSWVARVRESPDDVLKSGGKIRRYQLFTTTELLQCYDPSAQGKVTGNGLARELRRQGFRKVYNGESVPTRDGPQRLWAVRNVAGLLKIESSGKLRSIYEKERDETNAERKF